MGTETWESSFPAFVAWWSAGVTFHVFLYFLGVMVSPRHAEELTK